MIIAGKHKGQDGRVMRVIPNENKAIVEGKNMVKRHTKPNAQNTQGGIIEKEAPIHMSNLMVVDSKGNVTRVKRERKDGKLVRVSKKSGEEIK